MGDLMKSETKAKWRQICVFFLAVLITAATFILLAVGILWQGSSNENANKNQLGETYTPPPPQNVALMFLWDEGGGDIFYLDFKEKKITATILPKNCDENAALVYGYHEFEAVKADFLLFSSIVDRLGGIDLEIKGENLRFTGIQAATLVLSDFDDFSIKRQVILSLFEKIASRGFSNEDFMFIINNSNTTLSFPDCYGWEIEISEMAKNITIIN